MKTTDYGAAGACNEFGVPKPAKDVDYAHSPGVAMTGTRLSISDSTIREMVTDFHRIHQRMPSRLFMAESCGHYRSRGLSVPLLGIVVLDIEYGAPETRLE